MSNKFTPEGIEHILLRFGVKLDAIHEKMAAIDVTLERNTASLEEHIRRTELLEQDRDAIREELKPIQKNFDRVEGALKFVGILAVGAGLVTAAIEVFTFIKQLVP